MLPTPAVLETAPPREVAGGRRELFPWARLGLRWNPFGEPPEEDRAGLIVLPEAGELAAPLERPRRVVQLLGHAGRGKTARLRWLERHFPGTPYLYLGEDEPLPTLPWIQAAPSRETRPALLLDEAQRLPRRRRRRLFRQVARRGRSLGVSSHRDLTDEMEAAGLEVTTRVVAGLSVTRLLAILDRRLEWARRADAEAGAVPRLDHREARRLLDRFGDDLRGLLDSLYEHYQALLDNPPGTG